LSVHEKKSDLIRRCVDCVSSHTYTKRSKNGTPYPHWYRNPYKEGTWVCGKCHKYRQNHGNYPSKEDLADLRNQRLNQRICYECQAKTQVQRVGSSSYYIWHHHPEIKDAWLCAKCYARRYYAPKKKFKTKEERYEYMSKLFRGDGNPMYDVHFFGRTYTPERNEKVSQAVKKWAALHPEHYKKIGIKGALKARKLGLSGLPTRIEEAMQIALYKNKIRYVQQYRFKIGIMDFYLPDAKIALFVDGTIWHADPMIYKEQDRLFFSRKISRDNVSEKMTAKEVWVKDAGHNAYLESRGFIVLRFWEREIKGNIDKCIELIRLRSQRRSNSLEAA
jgi:DNA mismatch endonuclease, patch repair protein